MAAPRPGFDPTLHFSGADGVESNHTVKTAKDESALKAPAADAKAPAADAKAPAAPAAAPAKAAPAFA